MTPPPKGVELSLPVGQLRSVGSRNLTRLAKLGIRTVRNLLWHFPARYEDYSEIVPISRLQVGQKASIRGEVVKISTRRIFPRRMTVTDAIIQDLSGAVRAVWFNQPYISNSLAEGMQVSLAGKVNVGKYGVYLASPAYEKVGAAPADPEGSPETTVQLKHTSGLVPVYPETEGVTSKYLRFLIKPLLKEVRIIDPLPRQVLERQGLIGLKQAVGLVHYPFKLEQTERARKRLAFDDLLLFQLKALLERRKMNQLRSVSVPFDQALAKDFLARLPFELTQDQKTAAWEIIKDLGKSYPMNRLLEGDVGSGKTVVALMAAVQAAKAGSQSVFLSPTEVLAHQHFATITALTHGLGLVIAVMTGSICRYNDREVSKAELKREVARGRVHILIGTHAVIQKDVRFARLALAVVDEQHRFGIDQRAALLKQRTVNNEPQMIPHLLSMTATPIPRTLALTIFGDLDISIIKEKPKNRQKIVTKLVKPTERAATYRFIREQVKGGRQVFVICPRIENAAAAQQSAGVDKISAPPAKGQKPLKQRKMSELWSEVKAVQDEYERLSRSVFPDLKLAMLHGKMKSKEKQEVMQAFKDGWYDILVSTSVIEVGVDIPNAAIMMIEGADRFGLAQLHQFRGRVGRAEHQSYCLLFTTGDAGVSQRLKALVQCDDGFELAEKDMAIRGPGEFFGVKQSGMPDLAMASLADVELIKKARAEARLILKEDPGLKNYPLLVSRLAEFQKMHHFE